MVSESKSQFNYILQVELYLFACIMWNSPLFNYTVFSFFSVSQPHLPPNSVCELSTKMLVRGPCLTSLTWLRALLAIVCGERSTSATAECFRAIRSAVQSSTCYEIVCTFSDIGRKKKTRRTMFIFSREKILWIKISKSEANRKGEWSKYNKKEKRNTQTSTHSHTLRIHSSFHSFILHAILFSRSRALSSANSFHIFFWWISLFFSPFFFSALVHFGRNYGQHANWILI